MESYEQILKTAKRAAEAGAATLLPYFRSTGLEVGFKGPNDLVSAADRASEAAIVAEIRGQFPNHAILAEEGGEFGDGEYQWILDPLDGTANFVRGLPIYAVSVACRRGSELIAGVVLEPAAGNLFAAAKGSGATWNERPIQVSQRAGLAGAFLATGFPFRAHPALDAYLEVFRSVFLRAGALRRCGAAALDLAHVAAGIYDGFFEFRLAPWDVAAGTVLIREAGGRVSDLDDGDGFLERGNIIAGGPELHRQLQQLVQSSVSESLLDRLVPLEPAGVVDGSL